MNPRLGVRLLAYGRAAIGAAVLIAPEAVMTRWLGKENARHGGVKDLGRGLAARDIGLARRAATLDDPWSARAAGPARSPTAPTRSPR